MRISGAGPAAMKARLVSRIRAPISDSDAIPQKELYECCSSVAKAQAHRYTRRMMAPKMVPDYFDLHRAKRHLFVFDRPK